MTATTTIRYDDLAIDFAVGEVVEAFSILEVRGVFPTNKDDSLRAIETALVYAPSLPPHVSESIARTCQQYGFTLHAIVGAIRHLETDRNIGAAVTARTCREFLVEWRRQLRATRPVPKFGARFT